MDVTNNYPFDNSQDDPQHTPFEGSGSSPINPCQVSFLAECVKSHIDGLPRIWVEGQVIEVKQHAKVTYITLRDVEHEVSFPVQAWSNVIHNMTDPIKHGARVVMLVKPNYWLKTGRLSMQAHLIRTVGLGDLLARIETLRQNLAREGLFNPELKKTLPLLPRCVGVITGRNSDAGKDIRRNAMRRWPDVRFEYREVATQGANAVKEVVSALKELDAIAAIDVIVIARGGGSLEDLLPFSDESLIRTVFAAATPVVSAIGHESDNPILDNVADLRASTPTDAAKRIVPDVVEEKERLNHARLRLSRVLRHRMERETSHIDMLVSRQSFAHPEKMVEARRADIEQQRYGLSNIMNYLTRSERTRVQGIYAQLCSLSPQSTLNRGYAVVQNHEGLVVKDPSTVRTGEELRVKVAQGYFTVQVT